MKKSILIIVLTFISISSFAQTKTDTASTKAKAVAKADSVKVPAQELEQMINYLFSRIDNTKDISTADAKPLEKSLLDFYYQYFPTRRPANWKFGPIERSN